jgi:uncharacterized protein (DUF2384 family)
LPLFSEPIVLEGELEDLVVDPEGADPDLVQQEIAEQNLLLARDATIPESTRLWLGEFADALASLPQNVPLRIDPYLFMAAHRALLGAVRALEQDDGMLARRQLRIRLEQLRQVYRDISEGGALYEDRSAKEIVKWLVEVLDASQARIAELFSVSPRTLQRWASPSDPIGPDRADARRVRIIAAAVNHLRHALTGPGALEWFERPHPALDGARPLDLFDQFDAATRMSALAASTRSHSAA